MLDVMGLRSQHIFSVLQYEDRLQMSESDVYGRQILTTKVYPRTERIKTDVIKCFSPIPNIVGSRPIQLKVYINLKL